MSYIERIRKAQSFLDQKKGTISYIKKELNKNEGELKTLNQELENHKKALAIVKEVGQKTQEKLQFHISSIVTLAMETVFDNPYELVVSFVERRNQNECDLFFKRNDEICKPMEAAGGGTIDIASFALKIALWSMNIPKTDNTILLDEPFKYLDKTKHDLASKMIKYISDKLGIQFIIITHEEALTGQADKVFEVVKRKNQSKIIEHGTE